MTAPLVAMFIPEPWEDYPSTATPIMARRLARFETALAQLTAGMGAILAAGPTGSAVLAARTPEQARGAIGAASQADLNNRVVNLGGISGIVWVDYTPTAAALITAGITSGTLVLYPGGLGVLQGTRFIPIGLTSGGSLAASAAPSGVGTLSVVARIGAAGYAAQASGQGFLTVTGVVSGQGGTAAVLSGTGTTTVTFSVAEYTGRYNDTYSDTYGL